MITFTITSETVRQTCIRNNWYTHGTSSEYTAMLDRATWYNMCAEDMEGIIIDLMVDIRMHSDTDRMKRESGLSYGEIGDNIAHVLLNACTICID